jgi:hypothetical protein
VRKNDDVFIENHLQGEGTPGIPESDDQESTPSEPFYIAIQSAKSGDIVDKLADDAKKPVDVVRSIPRMSFEDAFLDTYDVAKKRARRSKRRNRKTRLTRKAGSRRSRSAK